MRAVAFLTFFVGAATWIVFRMRLEVVNAPCRPTAGG